MTDVVCLHCKQKIGEYYGSPYGAGKELRDKIGGMCPKCGANLKHLHPVAIMPWHKAFWIVRKPSDVFYIMKWPLVTTGLVYLFVTKWEFGLLATGLVAIGQIRLFLNNRREKKEIAVRA